MRKPLIGVTPLYDYNYNSWWIIPGHLDAVIAAGGAPVMLPFTDDEDVVKEHIERLDGIIFTGGPDSDPALYGEKPILKLGSTAPIRDVTESIYFKHAYAKDMPIIGICRGMQLMNILIGGSVWQDQPSQFPGITNHNQREPNYIPTHKIDIVEGSPLSAWYDGLTELEVNSFHHQAVSDCGERFRVTATAPDGIIEAMESSEQKAIIGVQWHPEWLEEEGLKLFQWLTERSAEFSKAKRLHSHMLTFDSHCDTPMFFPQGIHFEQRDPRILYDLHKMNDGRHDAVTMVAYLPQHPKPGEIPEGMSPKQYADSIFDQIEAIVEREKAYISIARTPDDLYLNKAQGRKSIMLGIENGLAIENDIANVEHFAKRGITYITLCHNGDNAICDSARGTGTHGGVSAFGEQVIHEMNRLGIMVDLSHGGEKSFYDALDISTTPIVCSHSNCKALCDVPRNLTDDQLRALAAKGGVAQTTMYHGFLKKEGEASILDAVAHLEHAIDIMGIDHVGVGTDFDGDGGIKGMADASEMINFTIQLLRRKYSETDIEKIWGGNWLRVMRGVKEKASVRF